MRLYRICVFVLVWVLGCASVGVRRVARPPTSQGYAHVELRDVLPLNKTDMNVEVEGALLGTGASETCGGVVTFNLLSASRTTPQTPGTNPTMGANANAISAVEPSGVVLSLPRARYAEVRDLRNMDLVRVRGYLSKHLGEGCTATFGEESTIRFLWMDTIERITPPAPAPAASP
jgi:hypothetical protein